MDRKSKGRNGYELGYTSYRKQKKTACTLNSANFDRSKTRKDMTHSVISIDSILLNSMVNGKIVIFRGRKNWHN